MVVPVQIALDHDRIFGALGDATRRDIVRRAIDGNQGVAELAAHYPMSFAAVQKHVAVLERAGLVSKHRSGRRKLVRTNLEGLRVARRLLDRYEELWRVRVERWWGPPTYPATVDAHDLRSGGRVEYHMTGPEGDQHRGFWEVDEVQRPHQLVFRDGFANEDGTPNTELPMTTARVTIKEMGGGKTGMSIESEFPTVEAMEQLAAMGAEEGLTQAVGQIDAILAEDPVARR